MKLTDQIRTMPLSERIGATLLGLGTVLLIIVGWYAFFYSATDAGNGTLAAVSFFIIMIGMVFYFPDMLKDETNGSISTMRVVVFMIVSVFVILCVKIGWSCKSMSEFVLDKTWAYILAAALGSKAVQSLGENNILGKATDASSSSNSSAFPAGDNKDPNATHFDPSAISKDVPQTPPPHITQ